ncbi:hypothetical protein LCGC14_1197860 [marine sediment metagenome]|uniref:Glyoxalase/fosfomycin resistance/dioxygenase domain-containing protein n=1 Tax=marine sediment metagenome TaxID=412755 RepID=A0A0F9M535_9ZZZZ|nr:MAG: hypothetical protein Lokiarch_01790 [Candidatus Lokiarchaeum sp. GC14_75]
MARAIPYLLVKNGRKTIELYENMFDAKLISHQPFTKEMGQKFGFPDDFDYENSTIHAVLEIHGATIYLADNAMGPGFNGSGNVEITLDLDSKELTEKIYEKAKKNGSEIKMELQQAFWGAWFARFEDSEGIGWQLNYSEEK